MHYTDITDAISKLTITGVSIKDIDEIPDTGVEVRAGGLLMPDPTSPITEMTSQPGTISANTLKYRYTMNYLLLYQQVGAGRGIGELMKGLVDMAQLVMVALSTSTALYTAGARSVRPMIKSFTTVQDATGQAYHGCQIAIEILEF